MDRLALKWLRLPTGTGTYAIFRQLRQHWVTMSHPVYRADLRRTAAQWLRRYPFTATAERGTRLHNWILTALIFIAIAVILPNLVAAIPEVVLSGLGILLFGATWISFVQLPKQTSRIIIEEREKQTWDSLLVLPLAWEDLILAKLAAALRTFSLEMILWLQTVFLIGLFALVIYQEATLVPFGSGQHFSSLLEIVAGYLPTFVEALIIFTIGRLQDFILVSLIGAIISLLSPSRQLASVGGIFAGICYALVNLFVIVLTLPALRLGSLFYTGELLAALTATGPMGSLFVGLPIPVAILALVTIILAREAMIRSLFVWLTRHLSER